MQNKSEELKKIFDSRSYINGRNGKKIKKGKVKTSERMKKYVMNRKNI